MKRILSMALVVAMLLSMMLFASIPAAAADDEVEGVWNTYGLASESDPDYTGEKKSVPGFEYTDDGFKMTTADWTTSSPFSQMSTIDKVDLKQGVYMQVRVDDFDYDAADTWFNFFLWSTPHIDEGAKGFGEGVQTIIRVGKPSEEGKPGKLSSISWNVEEFTSAGTSTFADDGQVVVDDKNILTFVVTYDGTNYNATINGSAAPEDVITYMNEHFGEDSFAHVGFAMLSSKAGGSQEATILKYGKTEADAQVPVSGGTDSKDAIDIVLEIADFEDMPEVAEGAPAILMTGNMGESHLANVPKSNVGNTVRITTDYTVYLSADKKAADAGKWNVDSDVSYKIEDFPVAFCITKNYCACMSETGCFAFESVDAYILTGDNYTAANNNKCQGFEICQNAFNINGDSYLYFWYDTSWNGDQFQGRINGTHFNFVIDNETVGANSLEVVLQAFFRTEEDAEAFALAYFESIGWKDGGSQGGGEDNTETNAPDDTETAPVEDTETDVPGDDDDDTKAPEQTSKPEDEPKEEAEAGCASAVGFGAIAIVAIATAAGFVAFKKKD